MCAVVLTFDGLDKVRRCVEHILAQTRGPEEVVVVDNHSGDGTEEYLKRVSAEHSQLRIHRTDENLGPAGGFRVGMELAHGRGHAFLWMLDDDSRPDPGCLEALLEAAPPAPRNFIVWPRNVDENGNETAYPAWRGELIGADAIERGGFPRAEFFWGQEDTEYLQWRLPELHGTTSVRAARAIVHYTQGNPRKAAPWHYYYLVRNTTYYRLWVQTPRKYWRWVRTVTVLWLRAVLKEPSKLKKTGFLIAGLRDGLLGRLGKTVDPGASGGTRPVAEERGP